MKLALLLLALFVFGGCVGTVQDAAQDYSKINTAPKVALQFSGITNAIAISDSRIEVFFYPAQGGSGLYTYDIIIGNQPYPISLPSDVMQPDYRGLLRYTVTGLDRLTAYQLKVEVRDKATEVQSNSGVTKTVTTFDNMVADFAGISSASNTPGQDGKDSIKVRWTPARASGGLTKQEWDPKSYEIVVVDADRLTPNDMDVATITPQQGRWVFGINHDDSVNEYIVRGLPSAKKFYVRMRCLHEASISDVYNPRKRSELNTKYVTISTLSSNLADINFQTDSFAVSLAAGEQGLNAVNASWTAAIGVFDHYRLYYSEENGGVAMGSFPDLCQSPLTAPNGTTVWCKKADFKTTATPITGLKPYTTYEVVLVLCATTTCTSAERIVSPTKTILTDPSLPTFNGIRGIGTASSIDELGNLYIGFEPPNFTTGYFDGLVLKMRRTTDGSDTAVELTISSTPAFHTNYNFLTDNQIIVKGVDYLSDQPYCFSLYPFKWNADGITRREYNSNVTWKCVTPKPESPTAEQFKGITSGTSEGNAVTINWDLPANGVYSYFEVFYRKQSGQQFNWGDAISQAGTNFNFTNYARYLVDGDKTTFTIDGIPNGQYYFGVITFFTYVTADASVVMRSETNTAIKKCTVDNTSPQVLDCN